MLLQNVQFEGPLGALIALVILFTAIVTALKGGQWFWQNVVKRIIERLNRIRVSGAEKEMLEFWQGFFDHRKQIWVLMLNDKKECIYISTGLAAAWGTDFHLVQGKRWRRIHRESTLPRYLTTLAEAYDTQSPFVHPVTIITGVEAQYLAKGEPYVTKNKLRWFVITMERMEQSNIRSIENTG